MRDFLEKLLYAIFAVVIAFVISTLFLSCIISIIRVFTEIL